MRLVELANDEFYHIYNRGVDKRPIFLDALDVARFFKSLQAFNAIEPVGSLYRLSFEKKSLSNSVTKSAKLVDIVCYALNDNHYHLLLRQRIVQGIQKFIHRLASGFTRYFNERYKRNGVLFQGAYKATHIDSNEYLLHLSAYINLNDQVHKLSNSVTQLGWTSWGEYIGAGERPAICSKEIILGQFANPQEYGKFAEEILPEIITRKQQDKELARLMYEE